MHGHSGRFSIMEKHFGTTKVLKDISFSLEKGQALSIIGSSGSGKTTLLRCLNFLETPDTGAPSRSRTRSFSTPPIRATQRESGDPEEAAPFRHGVPVLQPLPPVHGAAERDAGHGSCWPRSGRTSEPEQKAIREI